MYVSALLLHLNKKPLGTHACSLSATVSYTAHSYTNRCILEVRAADGRTHHWLALFGGGHQGRVPAGTWPDRCTPSTVTPSLIHSTPLAVIFTRTIRHSNYPIKRCPVARALVPAAAAAVHLHHCLVRGLGTDPYILLQAATLQRSS